jgi:hypothetical protein
MGAARQLGNGIIPPTKEVRRLYGRNADFIRKTARDAPLSGATQLTAYCQFPTRYPAVM